MAVTRKKKEKILVDLNKKFADIVSVVFARNNGLSVEEISELRRLLRKDEAEFKIAKKTLIRLAIKENKLPEIDEAILEGPIAAAFSYKDEATSAKTMATFAKKHDKLELMGAIVNGKMYNQSEVKALANLPSKEQLIAKLLGSMKSPINGFYTVLHGTLSGFVRVVDGYRQQKA